MSKDNGNGKLPEEVKAEIVRSIDGNTKYKPELIKQLIKYLEAGSNITTACKGVGITRDTYYRWLKDEKLTDISDTIVQKAEAKALIRNIVIIQNAAQKSWQAAAWFLERKDYENWGNKEIKGNTVNPETKVNITINQAVLKYEAAAEAALRKIHSSRTDSVPTEDGK